MDTIEFNHLAYACAPSVHVQTMAAIVRTESSYNPFAIGVVGGSLLRQPKNKNEAIATAKSLVEKGWNFSVGLAQVNRYNFAKYGLTVTTAFDPCLNLRAGSAILTECFVRALPLHGGSAQFAVRSALSCYYSGNFLTGYKTGYVTTVVSNAALPIGVIKHVSYDKFGRR